METTFKAALIISFAAHSVLAVPFTPRQAPRQIEVVKKPVSVDYIRIERPRRTAETPPANLAKPVTAQQVILPQPEKARKAAPADAHRAVAPAEDRRIRSTAEYIGYYQLIREKIRRRLKENYRDHGRQDDVTLLFTLGPDGALIAEGVDRTASSKDDVLIATARASLREAAPFPPFPKTLPQREMTFSLVVSFRKE